MPNPLVEAFEAAAGPPVPFCMVCLGPRRDALEILVVLGPEPVRVCTACGGPLDGQGRSALLLTADGVQSPIVVELQEGSPAWLPAT